MPLLMMNKIGNLEAQHTKMTLQLVDKSIKYLLCGRCFGEGRQIHLSCWFYCHGYRRRL